MRNYLIPLTLFFLFGCTTIGSIALSEKSLVGTWACGPITMQKDNFDLVVTARTTYKADHTFVSLTSSQITFSGKGPIISKEQVYGIWQLDGDIVTSTIQRIDFLSSSEKSFSHGLGQKIQDDVLKEKSVYQSRILNFDGKTSTSIPVNPMFKEAEVELSCKRT